MIDEGYEELPPFRRWLLEAGVSVGRPLGNFDTKLDGELLWGFGAAALHQLQPDRPAFIGIEMRYNNLQTQRSNWLDILDTGELADFTGSASSNMATFDLLYRYFPAIGFWGIEPYVEGRFGTRWMYTYETTTAFIGDFEEFSDTAFANSSWALAYGAAIGMQIYTGGTTYLNIRSIYTRGNSAQIDVKDDTVDPLDITFPIQGYRLTSSATSTLRFEVGLTFLL